jgi:hypothetical protein
MTAPVASGWSGWPDGLCTHWKALPCHGAHVKRTLRIVPQLGTAVVPVKRYRMGRLTLLAHPFAVPASSSPIRRE